MGCIWLSRNSDTFSVGTPQFDMTGIPGTFDSRLWILGSRYSFQFIASKGASSLGQTFIKIKHKVRCMVKYVQT